MSKVAVTYGIGWEKSQQLWYRANTKYFLSTTNFAQAALATISVAKDLALTANEQSIIDCAWKATGVVQGACAALTDPKVVPAAPGAAPAPGTNGATPGSTPGTATNPVPGGSDPDPAGGSSDGTSAPTKRHGLTPQASSGCSVGAPGGRGHGGTLGLLAVALGLALSRRRRR